METRIEVKLDLSGLDKLAAEFQAGIAAALETEGQATVADMKTRVPVRTGALRDSLGYSLDAAEPSLTLEATEHYAAYVEFGTRNQAAQSYFTPALDQLTIRLLETVKRAVEDKLR